MVHDSSHHHHDHRSHHFLLLSVPVQSHINPTLQFAKRLTRIGASVTYLISVSVHRRMTKTILPDSVAFVPFSDGYDNGFKPHKSDELQQFALELKRRGSQALTDAVRALHDEGRPVTCIVYTNPVRWIHDVAVELGVPSALLWTQPATVFDIYYYYYNGYKDAIAGDNQDDNPCYSIQLPGLPLLTSRDTPSFLPPLNAYPGLLTMFQEMLEAFRGVTKPRILVNSFDALEPDALRAVDDVNMYGIGPLVPSAFLDGKDPSDTCFGGDIFDGASDDYVEWLNTKAKASVVYVSFGSIAVLQKSQMEAIARGLLEIRLPFLWVIRQDGTEEKEEDKLDCMEELRHKGKIVPWCSQVEVLSHPSVGCFLTHGGWNSTFESLVTGVPVVAFPLWGDQMTNAKLIEDVWRTGVRVKVNEIEGLVESGEIRRCLEMVMAEGETREEMKRNANKWKDLARDAVKEGGSSERNLQAFMDEVSKPKNSI